jgi:hypothetical protein
MQRTLADFYKNPKLKSLNLKSVKYVPGTIGRTPAGVPIFECGEIKVPPPEIFAIKQIEELMFDVCLNLDLSGTFLMLVELPNLVRLEFKNCEIAQIPPESGILRNLTHLSFSVDAYRFAFNKFSEFPAEIGNLENLQELDLCDNRDFKRFPPEVSELRNLNYINLRGLPSLPENTELIPNLKRLRLYQSKITPEQIEPLVAKPNNLEWVTVNDYYYKGFSRLAEKYPNFNVRSEAEGSTMRGNY